MRGEFRPQDNGFESVSRFIGDSFGCIGSSRPTAPVERPFHRIDTGACRTCMSRPTKLRQSLVQSCLLNHRNWTSTVEKQGDVPCPGIESTYLIATQLEDDLIVRQLDSVAHSPHPKGCFQCEPFMNSRGFITDSQTFCFPETCPVPPRPVGRPSQHGDESEIEPRTRILRRIRMLCSPFLSHFQRKVRHH